MKKLHLHGGPDRFSIKTFEFYFIFSDNELHMCVRRDVKILFSNFIVSRLSIKIVFCESSIWKTIKYFSHNFGYRSLKLLKTSGAIVRNQPLKRIQNFEEFLNKCSNNHLKQPEGNFLECNILILFI